MNHTTTEERDALRAAARNYATPQELADATGATIGKARRAFLYNEMVDRGERPRRPGRDAGIIDGDYVTAYLPPDLQEFAFRYGGNNRSAGIRRAVEEAMARLNNGWGCELCSGTVNRPGSADGQEFPVHWYVTK